MRLFLLLVLGGVSLGCGKYAQRAGGVLANAPKQQPVPAKPSNEFADRRPAPMPQPPAAPPLPGETTPKLLPDALTAGIPQLPDSGSPKVEVAQPVSAPITPIVAVGAVGLPDDPTAANFKPAPQAAPPAAAPARLPNDLAGVRKLLDDSRKRYATLEGFECRLVKREVVAGKALPQDEVLYRFRQEPLSVYMKILSESGQGREAMYVKGKFDGKIHVLTGKGDNILVGVGYKTDVDPDSKQATSKSRYRIYEAGFGRSLTGLDKALNPTDNSPPAVRALGLVTRKEYPYALDAVQVTIAPGTDPLMPKGGVRQLYFDSKPDSPSYLMPVLVVTESEGKEVEYYLFDQFKTPLTWTDADWNPAKLGKKK